MMIRRICMVKMAKKIGFLKECGNCGYKWKARIESPKECPACKYRFDYDKYRKQAILRKSRR
jgi:predicted Zn-ribbon and HTH transcriptional regulator